MSPNNNHESEFTFRKNDDIGAAGAEDDTQFLSECFIDTGEIGTLLDCQNPRRVVVGRTGAGKTALLTEVANLCGEVISLSPHSLSINYIANNTVIRFFEDAGVNLSPFYSLLWKHIFVVELLKRKYHITSQESQKQTMIRLRELLSKDHIKELAIDYLENWGNKFWLTTEERMHELTSRIEKSLFGSLQAGSTGLQGKFEGGKKLTEEEKLEVVQLGKKAVSEVQIRELENLISVLDEAIFTDRQQRFYITIDTLDEEWADDRIRFRLIKSLIDTIRRFQKVENVEIIIALRQDLLDKVLHSTHDPGFQEEKYESLYLYVKWSPDQLRQLISKRLNTLVRRRYTKKIIDPKELFPNTINGKKSLDYIISRTFHRPRDAILFVNECIALSEGRPSFSVSILKKAEEEYSHKRLQSLATEWQLIYPNLEAISQMFYGMKEHFPVSEITKHFLCEKYTDVIETVDETKNDPMTIALDKLYTDDGNVNSVRNSLVRTLHFVGLFGIKVGSTSSISWTHETRLSLSPGQIRPSSTIHVHPMFHRALGIQT
jgi:hypothetical protein